MNCRYFSFYLNTIRKDLYSLTLAHKKHLPCVFSQVSIRLLFGGSKHILFVEHLEISSVLFELFFNQKPCLVLSSYDNAEANVRKGDIIGLEIVLRGRSMFSFLNFFFSLCFPLFFNGVFQGSSLVFKNGLYLCNFRVLDVLHLLGMDKFTFLYRHFVYLKDVYVTVVITSNQFYAYSKIPVFSHFQIFQEKLFYLFICMYRFKYILRDATGVVPASRYTWQLLDGSVFGLGRKVVFHFCKLISLSAYTPESHLTEFQRVIVFRQLEHIFLQIYVFGPKLKQLLVSRIFVLIEIKNYRGMRLKYGLPVHGQRTKTNAKTCRKLVLR